MRGIGAIGLVVSFIGVALILVLAGSGLINQATFFPTGTIVSVGGDSCTAKEGTLLVPIMGYYQCREYQPGTAELTITGGGVIACGSAEAEGPSGINEYTQNCKLDVNSPAQGSWWIFGQPTKLRWCVVPTGTPCSESDFKELTITESSVGKILQSITLQRGYSTYMEVQVKTGAFWTGPWIKKTDGTFTVTENWQKWALWQESRTARSSWVDTTGCYVANKPKLCLTGDVCLDGLWDQKGILDFNDATNYFENWAYGPSELNIDTHPTYGKVYCGGGSIYGLDKIKLTDGCYAFPSDKIGNVDCCPGEIAGNRYCGDDFVWKTTPTAQCISDLQCAGSGDWVCDYNDPSRKTLVKVGCVSGKCQNTVHTTACCNQLACQTGYVCVIDQSAGTGVCTQQSATDPNQPRQDTTGGEFSILTLWDYIVNYFIIFITALIISAIILGGIRIGSRFVPFIRSVMPSKLMMLLDNNKYFIVMVIIFAVILFAIFNVPVASIAASIFG